MATIRQTLKRAANALQRVDAIAGRHSARASSNCSTNARQRWLTHHVRSWRDHVPSCHLLTVLSNARRALRPTSPFRGRRASD